MRSIRSGLFASALLIAAAFAQAQAPAAPQQPANPQSDEPKNLQVLKGMSHDDLVQAMRFINQALGTECTTCHVSRDGHLMPDLDEKKPKATAREMLKMVKSINDTYFEGRNQVTCATCHAGHENPRPVAPIADVETIKARLDAQKRREEFEKMMAANRPQGQPGAGAPPSGGQPGAGAPPAGGQPGAQGPGGQRPAMGPQPAELFAKYVQAIGGADAVNKITTREDKYTTTNPVTGTPGPSGENIRKAPDKVVAVTNAGDRSNTIIVNGGQAWSSNARGTQPLTGPTLDQMKVVTNFWRDLNPTDRYSRARTRGKDKINGHDVYVVTGLVKDSKQSETLYFDVDSGLLLRRVTTNPTALGSLVDQIDFDDYRTVDGIKVPFVLKAATPDSVTTRNYTEIKFNVPVDDAKFAPPADAPKQSQ